MNAILSSQDNIMTNDLNKHISQGSMSSSSLSLSSSSSSSVTTLTQTQTEHQGQHQSMPDGQVNYQKNHYNSVDNVKPRLHGQQQPVNIQDQQQQQQHPNMIYYQAQLQPHQHQLIAYSHPQYAHTSYIYPTSPYYDPNNVIQQQTYLNQTAFVMQQQAPAGPQHVYPNYSYPFVPLYCGVCRSYECQCCLYTQHRQQQQNTAIEQISSTSGAAAVAITRPYLQQQNPMSDKPAGPIKSIEQQPYQYYTQQQQQQQQQAKHQVGSIIQPRVCYATQSTTSQPCQAVYQVIMGNPSLMQPIPPLAPSDDQSSKKATMVVHKPEQQQHTTTTSMEQLNDGFKNIYLKSGRSYSDNYLTPNQATGTMLPRSSTTLQQRPFFHDNNNINRILLSRRHLQGKYETNNPKPTTNNRQDFHQQKPFNYNSDNKQSNQFNSKKYAQSSQIHQHQTPQLCKFGSLCKFKKQNKCKFFHPETTSQQPSLPSNLPSNNQSNVS